MKPSYEIQGMQGALTMTGNELIAALQALSPEQRELPVASEGCDCSGTVQAVDICDGEIYLRRRSGELDDDRGDDGGCK